MIVRIIAVSRKRDSWVEMKKKNNTMEERESGFGSVAEQDGWASFDRMGREGV